MLDLIASGRRIAQIAADLDISDQTVYAWRRQEHPRGATPALAPCFLRTILRDRPPADAVLAENVVRAGQAAWWYSLRIPPSRCRRRMLRRGRVA